MSVRNHYPNPETRPPNKGTRKWCCYRLESVLGKVMKKEGQPKVKYQSLDINVIPFYVKMIWVIPLPILNITRKINRGNILLSSD